MKKTWKVAMYWGLFILFILVGEGIVCYEVYDKIKIKDRFANYISYAF